MIDPVAVATEAGTRMKLADPLDAQDMADAAIIFFKSYGGWDELTDDPLMFKGVVLLTERLYLDTPNPSGSLSSFDDFTSGTGFTPRQLHQHLDEYAKHLLTEGGFPVA